MERDMVLIRKILFAIEEKYTDRVLSYHDLGLNDYTPEVVAYHCSLLHDAQLVSSYVSRYADDRLYAFYVGRLTWEGHEFLDKIKNDTVWNKTLKVIKEKGLPLALDTVKDIAAAVAAAIENGLCSPNETVTVKTRGGDLLVKYTYDNIFLTGNAEMIFTGTTEF